MILCFLPQVLLEYHDAVAKYEEQLAAAESAAAERARRSSSVGDMPAPTCPVMPSFDNEDDLAAVLLGQQGNALPIGLHAAVRAQTQT